MELLNLIIFGKMRLEKFYYRFVTVQYIGIKNLVSKSKCIDLCRFFVTDGQFEDTKPLPQYINLTKDGALFVAAKKLEEGDIETAEKIIAWAEDQFVVWSNPCPEGRFSDTWILPGALEQYQCYMPIDASYSRFINIFSHAYVVTGKRLYLEKAKALADCIIRNQRESGEIPTFFQVSHYMTWLNCMIYTSQILLELDGRIQKSLANKN